MKKAQFIIETEEGGERLDRLLARRFPERSRTYFQYLLQTHKIVVDGSSVKKREKGKKGAFVEIIWEELPESHVEPQNIPFTILYEDEHFLAIDKPRGMVVHPGNGNRENTLVNGLLYKYPSLSDAGNPTRPGIVHRLDKETSGVILAVKSKEAHAAFVGLFQERQMEKKYLAICRGRPKEGRFEGAIMRHPVDRKKMTLASKGKEAMTDFSLLSEGPLQSLVLARPRTGRTHQIRVHLQALQSPILGDIVYGGGAAERLFLHAYSIAFLHPFTREPIYIKADPPAEFFAKLKKLQLSFQNL